MESNDVKDKRICKCGCGEEVFKDNWRRLPRFKLGHQSRGKFNSQWKNGSYINHDGYRLVLAYGHPRAQKNYVFEHIVIIEKKIGRYLTADEVVHHINEDKLDNRPENLQLFSSHGEHIKFHWVESGGHYRKG